MKNAAKALSLALASLMLLTACNNAEKEPVLDTSASTAAESTAEEITTEAAEKTTEETPKETAEETAEVTTEENSESSANSGNVTDKSKFPTDLYGLLGDNISPDEMTAVNHFGTEGSWSYIECHGFAYIAEPTGINYNSIDNADIFNSGDNSFTGSPDQSNAIYKRVYAGDEICGLTVETAVTSFINEDIGLPKDCKMRYFCGCSVMFKGEKEMSGYIVILNDDEYGVGGNGDIIFIPDNNSQVLPVINYDSIEQTESGEWSVTSNALEYTLIEGDIAFKNEYGIFTLGNIEDYGDMFDGAEKNKALSVNLTVENIEMSGTINWATFLHATVKDVKFN